MSTIEETLQKFIDIKEKISELEKKHNKYKELIEAHLLSKGVNKLEQKVNDDLYIVKKTMASRESISKKDLPEEIWSKYCSTSRYSVLTVKKSKTNG
jgi:hypothetical protein